MNDHPTIDLLEHSAFEAIMNFSIIEGEFCSALPEIRRRDDIAIFTIYIYFTIFHLVVKTR